MSGEYAAEIGQAVRWLDAMIAWADVQLADETADRPAIAEQLSDDVAGVADWLRTVG